MKETATATPVPRAELLCSAMERINSARSFKEFNSANGDAVELGLRLRPGFYGQRRKIHAERSALIRSARSEGELDEFLRAINYDEIMM